MADSSSPAIRVINSTPLARRMRWIIPKNRMVSHKTTATATTATANAAMSAAPFARRTNSIVATIAPGPASSGVPSGTRAPMASRGEPYARRPVRPPDEQHRGDDRPRPGEQWRAERNEGHVGLQPLGLGRLRHRTGQQLQRDEQEQQATGPLQRRELHTQIGQD